MGVVQSGDGLGFTLETLAELRGRNFDRYVAMQSRIARSIHLAHAAGADGRDDFIRAEFRAGSERHLGDQAKFSRSESH